MTHKQIAARLRGIAAQKHSDIWKELHHLAAELDALPEPGGDIEALVRATQPRPSFGRQLLRALAREQR